MAGVDVIQQAGCCPVTERRADCVPRMTHGLSMSSAPQTDPKMARPDDLNSDALTTHRDECLTIWSSTIRISGANLVVFRSE